MSSRAVSFIFAQKRIEKDAKKQAEEALEREDELMKKVGRLTIENDWLKKICPNTRSRLGNKIWFQEIMHCP